MNVKVEGIRLDPLRPRDAKHGQEVANQKGRQVQPHLAVGEELQVAVAGRIAGGRYLVNIRGSLLETTAAGQLNIGDALDVRVEQLQPQIVLRLLSHIPGEAGQALNLLRAVFPQQGPTSPHSADALSALLATLARLTQEDEAPASVGRLRTLLTTLIPEGTQLQAEHVSALVRDGGLQYEAKLLGVADPSAQKMQAVVNSDVKGLLLHALDDLLALSKSSGDMAPLAQHLSQIERQQAVNILAQVQNEPFQLQLPIFYGDILSSVLMSIGKESSERGKQEENEREGDPSGYRILFLLTLDGLGQTRIDACLTEQSVSVEFYVEEREADVFLQARLSVLEEALRSMGYADIALMAKPFSELSPHHQRQFDGLTEDVPASVSLLDVKV